MERIIACGDLGWDCPFEAAGSTGHERLVRMMRHVRSDHSDDWFELEEIHEALVLLERKRAA